MIPINFSQDHSVYRYEDMVCDNEVLVNELVILKMLTTALHFLSTIFVAIQKKH